MDARFPERWLNDRRLARATDSQFRLFTNANAWAVANRTDGHIPSVELSLIPRANTADAAGLVTLGLWVAVPDGWMIEGFLGVQTSKSQLDALDEIRAKNAAKQKAYRDRKRAAGTQPALRNESRNALRNDDRNDNRTETGQAALYSEASSETWNTEELGLSEAPSIPARRLKSVPTQEAEQRCRHCNDPRPLNADGLCEWCAPRVKEPVTW